MNFLSRATVLCVLVGTGCFDELGDFATGGAQGVGGRRSDIDAGGGGLVGSSEGGSGQGGLGRGGATAEDCTNGVDDDDDDLVDCADRDSCFGLQCAAFPAEEDGWSGPVLLRAEGKDEPCPVAYPTEGISGFRLNGVDNPCGCSCEAPTGVSCAATVSLFNDAGCGVLSATVPTGSAPSCVGASAQVGAASAISSTAGGSCAPKATAAEASFERVTTCATAGAGCEIGHACVRSPSGGDTLCVHADGVRDCPLTFPLRHVIYTGDLSNVTCDDGVDCACGAPQDTACSTQVELRSAGCTSPVVSQLAADGACSSVLSGPQTVGSLSTSATATGGSCVAQSLTDLTRFGDRATLCCADGI